jgi:hypothetical protein
MGKGSGSSQTYDYYASLACWICEGPVEELVAVVIDQRVGWPKAKAWVAGTAAAGSIVFYQGRFYRTLTGTSAVPPASPWTPYSLTSASATADGYTTLTVEGLGTVRFYWGSPTQLADPLLTNTAKTTVDGAATGHVHPPYRGVCYAVLDDCLLGRERAAAPNLRFVVRRVPQQLVITGAAAALDDAQANALAVLAEIFTHGRAGLGLANARLDATSWQTTADALHAERARAALSPVWNQRQTVRQAVAELAGYTDLWLRYHHAYDLIEAGAWRHGSPPVVATVLGPDQWQAVPALKVATWAQAATQAVVQFADRENLYKQVPEPVADLRARRIVGEDRPQTLTRPFITRRPQARALGAEWLRSRGRPVAEVTLRVRRSIGLALRPGDWVRPDLDPEPGSPQLLVYARVVGRTVPALKDGEAGDITLQCEVDETQAPLLYTPAASAPVFAQPTPPAALTAHRLLEAPAALAEGALSRVLALARRPSATHVGFDVWFDSAADADSDFDRIGRQDFFAVKAELVADLAANALSDAEELPVDGTPSASALRLRVPVQVDDRLFNSPVPGVIAANNDALLLILVETSGGAVGEDAAGVALVEVLSVVEWQAYGPNTPPTYAVRAYRRRLGTAKVAFTAANAEAWLIRREALTALAHADFAVLKRNRLVGTTPDTGTFRLQPVSLQAVRSLADCADVAFAWPKQSLSRPRLAWEAPGQTSWPHTFGTSVGGTLRLVGRWRDADSNLVAYSLRVISPGGVVTALLSQNTAARSEALFDVSHNCNASGTWRFVASAVDSDGLTEEVTVESSVPASAGQVATPTASPAGGFYNTFPRTVTLACATSGATIYYQLRPLSGAPTGTWATYASAFSAGKNVTVYAYAAKAGMTDSPVVSWDFEYDSLQ